MFHGSSSTQYDFKKNQLWKKRGMDSIFINDIRQDLQDYLDI
jgi:hypothetical protein